MISLLNITKLVMDMSMTEMRYKYIWFLIEIIIIRMNGSFALETQKWSSQWNDHDAASSIVYWVIHTIS